MISENADNMPKQTGKKLLYINNLRIVLITLIVMIHISITYGADGSWYYSEPNDEIVSLAFLTIFNTVVQSFALGFFFMISGYFTTESYPKKGPGKYLIDRFVRLGIPLFIYFFIINPLIVYLLYVKAMGESVPIQNFFGTGPLWFVEALLIFSLCYHVRMKIIPEKSGELKPPPKNMTILKYALMLSIANFVVRIFWPVGESFSNLQFGFFPGYIGFFIFGIIAYRNKWFDNFNDSVGVRWLLLSVIGIIVLPMLMILGGAVEDVTPFRGGVHWQSLTYSVWEAFVGTGLIAGLFIVFRKRFDSQTWFTKSLSDNVYTVFIIHAPVIIFFTYIIREIHLYPLLKFALVSVFGISLCFPISHFIIRRIPYSKRVL